MFSIVIPVYNEEEILRASLTTLNEYLSSRLGSYEIIVVSNGSTDNTVQIGEEIARNDSRVRLYALPEKGVGEAFKVGVREAKGDAIISLDIDLSSDLVFIDYAKNLLPFSDMVVGSKTMGHQRRSFVRIIGSQLYILISLLFFDLTLSDFSIGCKAYQKSAILPLLPRLSSWTGYVLELALLLNREGKKIVQVGISCNDTRPSHFNLLHEGFYRYYHLFTTMKKMSK